MKRLALKYWCLGFLIVHGSLLTGATEESPPDSDIPDTSDDTSSEDTSDVLPDMGPMPPSDEPNKTPEDIKDVVPESQKSTQQETPPENVIVTPTPSHRFAAGFNLAWTSRQDYGSRTFRRLTPEIVGFTYGALPREQYWWRVGLRIGYSTAQPEMPQAIRIEESDTTALAEVAITKDWYIVPSFAIGSGYDFRKTNVKVSGPIDTVDDRINRKETLWMWYVQAGAGLPLLKGLVLIEPTVRYHTIQYDNRSHWMFGIETTVGI